MTPATVLVARRTFLPLSETFIADHLEGLRRWRPVVAHTWSAPDGLLVPDVPAARVLPAGRARRFALERLGLAPGLDRWVGSQHVRLVHAHFLTDAVGLATYARRRRLPLVATAHGYDATIHDAEHARTEDGRAFLRGRRALFRAAAAIFCVSRFIRDELVLRGAPPEKLRVRPLGLNLAGTAPGPPAGERRGVLFAGRLVEKKGVGRLLSAWLQLPAELRVQGLTVVGGGPELPTVRAFAAEHPEVEAMGAQPREVIGRLMRERRVFAFPSARAANGDAEGMGVVGMEAQAAGAVVVAFDDGPARELLEPEGSGLLAPLDIAAYAGALGRVLADDALASRLGARGPGVVRERFDLRASLEQLELDYDEVAAPTR